MEDIKESLRDMENRMRESDKCLESQKEKSGETILKRIMTQISWLQQFQARLFGSTVLCKTKNV